jgi:hypothetical protein
MKKLDELAHLLANPVLPKATALVRGRRGDRIRAAAEACLLEQPNATANLVCAAVLRETYAMAKKMDEGEFAASIAAEGNQIRDDLTLVGQRTG